MNRNLKLAVLSLAIIGMGCASADAATNGAGGAATTKGGGSSHHVAHDQANDNKVPDGPGAPELFANTPTIEQSCSYQKVIVHHRVYYRKECF